MKIDEFKYGKNYITSICNFLITGQPRTNNHCEGYHNRINRLIGTVQNSVFKFVQGLIDEQTDVEHQLARVEAGNDPAARRPKYVKAELKIINLVKKFKEDVFDDDFLPYLLSIAHNTSM